MKKRRQAGLGQNGPNSHSLTIHKTARENENLGSKMQQQPAARRHETLGSLATRLVANPLRLRHPSHLYIRFMHQTKAFYRATSSAFLSSVG